MIHKLIHTPNYLLVVDDSEIKKGDKSLLNIEGFVPMILTNHEPIEEGYEGKKIIAHLPLNNSPILEGVDLLAPLETEDFNPTGEYTKEYMSSLMFDGKSFVSDVLLATRVGYNKAKKKYKYTLKDINIMVNNCVTFAISNTHLSVGEYATKFKDFYDKCIQSLNLSELPTSFECEIEHFYMSNKEFYKDAGWVKCDEAQYKSIKEEIPTCPLKKVHKETTTPEGHTQWVGKYIY
jgi:hypothetical protein